MDKLENFQKVLLEACGQHPAHRISFDQLYQGLMNNVEKELVSVVKNDDLELFSYTITAQFDKLWDIYSIIARGLILCPSQKKVVCTGFPKFFNYGEVSTYIPDLPFEVSEKVDGSCGFLRFWDGKWRVSTRGSFFSDQAKWATYFINDPNKFYLRELDEGTTYITEIIYPENKIVVDYKGYEGLKLITAYDEKGYEIPWNDPRLAKVRRNTGFGWVNHYPQYKSIDELLQIADTLPYSQEGFVLRFSNGFRIKIKSKDYLRVHRLISNCTPLAIWESMCNCDDIDLVRKDLPEEMHKDFDSMRSILQLKLDMLIKEIKQFHQATVHMSDKELGLMLKSGEHNLTSDSKNFIFLCRKKDFLNEVNKPTGLRKKAFKTFQPKGNKLPGYSPSSAMNRFEELQDS